MTSFRCCSNSEIWLSSHCRHTTRQDAPLRTNGWPGEAPLERPRRRPRSAEDRFSRSLISPFLLSALSATVRLHIQQGLAADSGGQGGQRLGQFDFYQTAALFSLAGVVDGYAIGSQQRCNAAQFGPKEGRLAGERFAAFG